MCMKGWSGLNQIIPKSMQHTVGQDRYVEDVVQGVVGVTPVSEKVCFWFVLFNGIIRAH